MAEEKEIKNGPLRSISLVPELTGIITEKGESIKMDLFVYNEGRSDEDIQLELIAIPKGWQARIMSFEFNVNGVFVTDGNYKRLTFLAEPDIGTGPGKYIFRIRAKTEDGLLSSTRKILITVAKEAKEAISGKGVKVTALYPVLQGPTDAIFEFSIEVENRFFEDKVFILDARGPEKWEINFKPAWETKYISSISLKANKKKNVDVEVKPYSGAKPGQYPIVVSASSDESRAETRLNVNLTGTNILRLATPGGRLSLDVEKGKGANMSIYVKNSGSAPQKEISLISFKPENWKVKFKPENIESLNPGDLEQVEVTITPAEDAIVGDYSVGIEAKGEKTSTNAELRVSVKASTTWGWIGIAIIVMVIGGLTTLFRYFGRR
jgi:uncharacterized membrane protein